MCKEINMKNRIGLTAAAILAALALSACSNNAGQSGSSSSSTSSSNKSSQVQKSSTESSKTSSSKKPSSQAPKESRIDLLTSKLRKALPGMLLPTKDGLGTGSDKLNVRYTTDNQKNVIYYSVGNTASAFNAASVANEKPYAVLTEYKSVSNADDIINYMQPQTGLPTVKLDDKTTATSEGAAGHKYLQWNQGQWSFVVDASTVMKQDPTATAKKLLSLVNEYNLPETSTNSSVQVTVGESVGSLNTVISWKSGDNVYQMKAHDTTTAFKMLSSLQ